MDTNTAGTSPGLSFLTITTSRCATHLQMGGRSDLLPQMRHTNAPCHRYFPSLPLLTLTHHFQTIACTLHCPYVTQRCGQGHLPGNEDAQTTMHGHAGPLHL